MPLLPIKWRKHLRALSQMCKFKLRLHNSHFILFECISCLFNSTSSFFWVSQTWFNVHLKYILIIYCRRLWTVCYWYFHFYWLLLSLPKFLSNLVSFFIHYNIYNSSIRSWTTSALSVSTQQIYQIKLCFIVLLSYWTTISRFFVAVTEIV